MNQHEQAQPLVNHDELPDELQPLSAQLLNDDHIVAHARNTVKNVLDSYTGKFDVLAESVQNSMDALEKRWATETEFALEFPRLVVRLDAAADEVSVMDNGTGIRASDLLSALVPHMSPKSLDASPTRGHKGVGTTFLAYGHPAFEVRTKTQGAAEVAYRINGGLAWTKSSKITRPPRYEKIPGSAELAELSSGTLVRVGVGEETRFGRLKTAQYNKLATWALVLRTFTAIGTLSIGLPAHKRPEWLKHLKVELHLSGVASSGSQLVEPGFQLPHLDAVTKVSLQQLSTGASQLNARYELLYAEYDNAALEQVLAPQLQQLADSDQAEDQEILNAFRAYDTSVYASWAYKNTWYEDLFRIRIGEEAKRYQYNNVRSGLLVTSVGMPIGEVTDHPYVTMKPEYRRRLFVAVGFNERYSPDLGRKTIPATDRVLLSWLETQLQNLFVKHTGRLIKANDDSPHNAGTFGAAREELTHQVEDLRKKHNARQALGLNLGLRRAPNFESELVAIFSGLVATNRLAGYNILAIPGSATRYDALFDFVAPNFDQALEGEVPLGISATLSSNGLFSRKGKWLEFKLRLEELVEDFTAADGDAGKKYFDLLDVAVVWSIPAQDAIEEFDVHKFDATSWQERNFYGATHWLGTGQVQHRVEIIAVQDLLYRLATAST